MAAARITSELFPAIPGAQRSVRGVNWTVSADAIALRMLAASEHSVFAVGYGLLRGLRCTPPAPPSLPDSPQAVSFVPAELRRQPGLVLTYGAPRRLIPSRLCPSYSVRLLEIRIKQGQKVLGGLNSAFIYFIAMRPISTDQAYNFHSGLTVHVVPFPHVR